MAAVLAVFSAPEDGWLVLLCDRVREAAHGVSLFSFESIVRGLVAFYLWLT